MNRMPILDGWRGLAIAFVLIDHVQVSLNSGYYATWTQTGQHGVTLFFILSGYLITTNLLLRGIDFREFYVRRFFKLMPVAWVYLLVVLLPGRYLLHLPHSVGETFACVFFFQNYWTGSRVLPLDHFWSLSIEEQFYLIWPALLFLTGARWARWLCVAGMVACATYRFLHWGQIDGTYLALDTHFRVDALLAGCLLALLLSADHGRWLMQRGSKLLALPALGVVLFSIAHYPWLPPLMESVSLTILVAATITHSDALSLRWLSWKPLTVLGVVSYSVYIWQGLFTVDHGSVAYRLSVMALAPSVIIASYYFVERPFNRYGHELASRMRVSRNAPLAAAQMAD